MLMSIATLEGAPAGIIPAHLEQARYLMIVEMDTHECLEVLDGRKKQKPDVFFARMTVNRNCEAIICGDIRKEAFDILSEAQVTRYNGAALQAQEIRKRVNASLRLVGMYEYRMHAPHLLSGGQKQRVAIAGIIAMMPRCIVLDEATAMLDPVGRRETVDTIKELNEKYGITVVLITHHMDEAAQAQRLVVMAGGRIIDDGPPKEVFQHVDTLRAAGLSVPESVALLYELRQEGFNVPLDALSDEECAAVLTELLSK